MYFIRIHEFNNTHYIALIVNITKITKHFITVL